MICAAILIFLGPKGPYQTADDIKRFPTYKDISQAMIAGRWGRAKQLLNEIGSFTKPEFKSVGRSIASELCHFAGSSDKYSNALTGIRLAHDYGADVTGLHNYALAIASSNDEWGQITERLIEYGAKPDKPCKLGVSAEQYPLMIAISYNKKLAALEILLKHGASANQLQAYPVAGEKKGFVSITPLMLAVKRGRADFVNILLTQKAKVNQASPETGMTPLHYAAKLNRQELIPLLLREGADRSIRNSDGMTALQVAQKVGARQALRILQRH
jgi:ankyrin repeat protein